MGPKRMHAGKPASPWAVALAAACGACLAVTLLAAGFAACAAQPTTRLFSTLFSDVQTAPYEKGDLVDLAVATRDYTVCDYGRRAFGTGGAREAYCQAVVDAAQRASAEGSPVAGKWRSAARAVAQDADGYDSATGRAYALAAVSQRYALDAGALDHLDDCYAIIGPVVPRLWAIAAAAAASLAVLVATGHRRLAGAALVFGPLVLLAFMVACGIWAAVDFDAFFGMFHAVLFPQGNWTFPADSLLICMLPQGFWVSMGALWLAVTVTACIIAMFAGKRLRSARMESNKRR